jgi:hypothetical protein
MTTPTVLKTGRAAAFAAVCVGLSASGHASMGPVPSARAVFIAVVAVFFFARACAGRERGLAAIATVMVGAQAFLHVWFVANEPSVAGVPLCTPVTTMPEMCPDGASGMAPMGHVTMGMILAHVVAGVTSAWWLRRGEVAAFALVRWITALALELVLPSARLTSPADVGSEDDRIRTRRHDLPGPAAVRRTLRFQVIRRGPPRCGTAVPQS